MGMKDYYFLFIFVFCLNFFFVHFGGMLHGTKTDSDV